MLKTFKLVEIHDPNFKAPGRRLVCATIQVNNIKEGNEASPVISRYFIEVRWPAYTEEHYTAHVEQADGKKLNHSVAAAISDELKRFVGGWKYSS